MVTEGHVPTLNNAQCDGTEGNVAGVPFTKL